MHPRCATCKHFNPDPDEWDVPEGWGRCDLIEMASHMTGWSKDAPDKPSNALKPEYEGHTACVMDASSYSAVLNPSPDFYCAMHSDLAPDLVTRETVER